MTGRTESRADVVERVLRKYVEADPDGYEASVVRRHRELEARQPAPKRRWWQR